MNGFNQNFLKGLSLYMAKIKCQIVSYISINGGKNLSDFYKKISLIGVPNIKEILQGLERREGQ